MQENKTATRPETFEPSQKCVQGVCLDTEHAPRELSQTNPLPQKTHVKYPCLVAWAGSGGGYQCPCQSMQLAPAGLTAQPQTTGSHLSSWLELLQCYKRHRGDSSPCRQSPMDFESIPLTARAQCQLIKLHCLVPSHIILIDLTWMQCSLPWLCLAWFQQIVLTPQLHTIDREPASQ